MVKMKELANRLKELEDQLVICIKCGMCQSVCPLFDRTRREADVARGKLALLDGLGKNLFTNPDGVNERLNRCLLCGSCAANCPSGVNVVEIFIKARAILAEFKGLSPAKKLIFQKMLSNPETFDKLTEWAGKFQNIFTKKDKNAQGTSCARVVSPLFGDRHFLPMSDKPFHSSKPYTKNSSNISEESTSKTTSIPSFTTSSIINTNAGKSGLKVAFFTGCIIDKIFPHIGQDVIDVFEFHGVGLYIPTGQGCCGIPALASGDMKSFEKLVEYHIKLFNEEKFDYLVTACATCTSTIKKLWSSIYKGNASRTREKIKELSHKTLDINQFLVNKVRLLSNDASFEDNAIVKNNAVFKDNGKSKSIETVTYHDPCHLKKSLGVFKEPRILIKASGNKLVEMEGCDKCCGMGGSFNLYHYDISSEIGQIKSKNIADTNCSTVATGCPACMVQISDMLAKNNLDIKVCHPIELYAKTLRNKQLS
ncbi:MAG: (Fe-S)-binding protein [Desulfamplus sp.]|nr:(Fe-S)-binding protein [Desulfamplus sp.]